MEFYELVRALFRLGKNTTEAALHEAKGLLQSYFKFLRRASAVFGLALVFVLIMFILGAATDSRPVISVATFFGGLAVFLWLLAAFPIVWAVQKGLEWESTRKTFEWIGVATLWVFFLSIYFYFVPVPPAGVPLVMVLAAAMAIASVLFGVGISARFIALRLGLVFTAMTIFFVMTAVMPNSFGGLGKLFAWFDTETGEAMDDFTVSLVQPTPYSQDLVFFDPNGRPQYWYYRTETGEYQLFKSIRRHPRYGVELQPITEAVVRELEKLNLERAREEKEEIIAAEEKLAEKQRLVALEQSVKDAQEKAAEAAKAARMPGPRGLAGEPGPAGPRGDPGTPGESGRTEVVIKTVETTPPTPAPTYEWVTIPAGTRFSVLLNTELATDKNQVGDTFSLEVIEPVVNRGRVVIPERTPATGRIVALERPGRVSGVASISLSIVSIGPYSEPAAIAGNHFSLETEQVVFFGEETKGEDATKVGVGAGVGALIGGLLGGRDGAAAGAAIGGGGAATAVMATRGREVILPPEKTLEFRVVKEVPLFEVVRQ
ncbi:MAG: collagen-like protein [Parcubacteria group bacterium]|nr:collagen-like protein [Parcubacteria group bacterium]